MNKLQEVYSAVKQVLGEQMYGFIVLSFALLFFGLFVFIPVATTPGNTLAFQLSIFRVQDYFLMVFLAFLVGLNFSMNIYVWRKRRQSVNISKSAASGTAAGFGGAFAAIVGTATCASCLASLFGIMGLGIGSVAFVLKYQTLFLLGAIALVVISLYFTARKINRVCNSC
ncbi:hypothetical protein A3G55_01820 [Candidatus Giovannonibacteria bacterium RIFCSPLOWO2_12_FULL_44_25]|uniref:Uncharacterized protein n=3 Tax=Parcubacteria group TaxID=1794811 RepID=A0A837IGN8_9BACT|nr:MAG: hypothetical protein UX18_C0023G0020 [Candidatus Azambacteria bacterium GW2011_GWC2_45_7b]OGF49387.1 MAG: hypothetical protein A2120_03655 [Candidatus Giovannonibacteria bacterium GWA2_45_15]OGF59846.1 MAG: hypothetical protein A2W40_01945 [Candidatus Giovannonibacteria bacterium RIFCSPHIGHO2_01_45_12]OGF61054.1 MAG: hypothetical protein A2656_02270 [Candidatus Giovannonibacteria bacterium RIFCSPHIGHO2_01_FULL_44_100]OGF71252.1 MAG: hypothetical protein A3C05_04155 [Candidatus Giovannon